MTQKDMLQRLALVTIVILSIWTMAAIAGNNDRLAFACSCESQPPDENYANAQMVVSGQVNSIESDPRDEENNLITFNVTTVWKSKESNNNGTSQTGDRLLLSTSKDSGLCGYPFEQGHEYLVYTYADGEDDTIQGVGLCGTKDMESAAIDIAYFTTGVSFGHPGDRNYNLVMEDGQTHPLTYSIIGGNVTSITVDKETKSLILMISPIQIPSVNNSDLQDDIDKLERTLTLKLPRDILDAKVNHPKMGEMDVEFAVMTFEKEGMTSYPFYASNPVGTPEERWIRIPFNATTDMIRVTGTKVIPEFGSLSVVIAALSIGTVLVMMSRSGRLRWYR